MSLDKFYEDLNVLGIYPDELKYFVPSHKFEDGIDSEEYYRPSTHSRYDFNSSNGKKLDLITKIELVHTEEDYNYGESKSIVFYKNYDVYIAFIKFSNDSFGCQQICKEYYEVKPKKIEVITYE